MARGDGVPRVPALSGRPAEPAALPEGREGGDARGATWPVIAIAGGLLLGLTLAAIVLASAWLRVQGIPIKPFIDELTTPLLGVAGLLTAALLARVLNTTGRTQRSQGALAQNQLASAERFDLMGRALHELTGIVHRVDERVDRIDERIDVINDGRAEGEDSAVVAELRTLRDMLAENGARLGRVAAVVTGQQPAVPPATAAARREQPEDPPALVAPSEAGFGSWRRAEPEPETGPLPTFEEILKGRVSGYRPPRERGEQPPPR
jgi:hypothetical protein